MTTCCLSASSAYRSTSETTATGPTNVPLGKVYQTAPGNVNQIISPDQNPAAAGDWGAVADSNGVIRYVPAKDSHGRPYGGSINGAITFRVFDGFSLSDNFGEVTFAVDTPAHRHRGALDRE